MNTTTALLRLRSKRGSPWPARFAEVANRLVHEYGIPCLGNFDDPVKEICYILLSAKTTDAQYRETHRLLWSRFPTLTDLAGASVRDIRACIRSGGLAGKRAPQIRGVARALIAAGGDDPARFLRELSTPKAYAFLCNLPGMGPKSALCVLMYSLDADAFPVDANVHRIAERMGALSPGLKHYQAQRRLPVLVPEGRARELHIGMVAHGRSICLPRRPKCGECALVDLCRRGRKEVSAIGNRTSNSATTSCS